MSKNKITLRSVLVAVMLIAIVVIFAVLAAGSRANAAVREISVVLEKTGIELVAQSPDKVISKYVDYDADVICYRTSGSAFTYQPNAVALSCIHQ